MTCTCTDFEWPENNRQSCPEKSCTVSAQPNTANPLLGTFKTAEAGKNDWNVYTDDWVNKLEWHDTGMWNFIPRIAFKCGNTVNQCDPSLFHKFNCARPSDPLNVGRKNVLMRHEDDGPRPQCVMALAKCTCE